MSIDNPKQKSANIKFLKTILEVKTGISPELFGVVDAVNLEELDGVVVAWTHGVLTLTNAIINREEKKEEFEKFQYAQKFVSTHKLLWQKNLRFVVEEGEKLEHPYPASIYLSCSFLSNHIVDVEEQLELPEVIKGLTKDERYVLTMMLLGNLSLNEYGEEQLSKVFNVINRELERKDLNMSLLITHSLSLRWLIKSL